MSYRLASYLKNAAGFSARQKVKNILDRAGDKFRSTMVMRGVRQKDERFRLMGFRFAVGKVALSNVCYWENSGRLLLAANVALWHV